VPVFVFGCNAFAEGVGEALHPIDLPPAWYVVLEPPVQVPTAAIFGAPELCRNTAPIRAGQWLPGFGGNDLESVATARFPVVAEYIRWLSTFSRARMSGSGACVFAEFERREEAEAVLHQLPAGMRGWIAAGLDRHPLRSLAA
jgi:4-diphosphocytidyl-2-C-methyl-D-erythritol kinase